MRIIDTPQYGPMFRFTDANVYWALYILSDGKRMGRKRLADEIGVGEGSMRRILETLRQWEMITINFYFFRVTLGTASSGNAASHAVLQPPEHQCR